MSVSLMVRGDPHSESVEQKANDFIKSYYSDKRLHEVTEFCQSLITGNAKEFSALSSQEKTDFLLSRLIEKDLKKIITEPEFQKACQPLRNAFPGRQGLEQEIELLVKEVIQRYEDIFIPEIIKSMPTDHKSINSRTIRDSKKNVTMKALNEAPASLNPKALI